MIAAAGHALYLSALIFICGAYITIYADIPVVALLPLLPHALVYFEL